VRAFRFDKVKDKVDHITKNQFMKFYGSFRNKDPMDSNPCARWNRFDYGEIAAGVH
jgi:hypothetical protein